VSDAELIIKDQPLHASKKFSSSECSLIIYITQKLSDTVRFVWMFWIRWLDTIPVEVPLNKGLLPCFLTNTYNGPTVHA